MTCTNVPTIVYVTVRGALHAGPSPEGKPSGFFEPSSEDTEMDGIWDMLVRAFATDPGFMGAKDGKSGYPGAGHGMAVALYGAAEPERTEEAPAEETRGRGVRHG